MEPRIPRTLDSSTYLQLSNVRLIFIGLDHFPVFFPGICVLTGATVMRIEHSGSSRHSKTFLVNTLPFYYFFPILSSLRDVSKQLVKFDSYVLLYIVNLCDI